MMRRISFEDLIELLKREHEFNCEDDFLIEADIENKTITISLNLPADEIESFIRERGHKDDFIEGLEFLDKISARHNLF